MKLLLDTHAWLWFCADDARLSAKAKAAIESPANERFVSIATVWELSLKVSLGKLRLADPLEIFLPQQIRATQASLLPIELHHCIEATRLPFHHRDPFDRLLIAQAISDGLMLVSADMALNAYGVMRVW